VIVGTAGHIDHGKTLLVEALTGRRLDPLAEERRRGITLDLHFAPLPLPDGRVAGVIDVPGHEDLVRTMVAGASGIRLALLVVAADDGPKPQTWEHLAVLEALAVPAAIPVITKADLVEPDWLELVREELTARLARSPVPFGPPTTVSARTGAGIDALRARIVAALGDAAAAGEHDLFRMPVDRGFTVAGTGTVLTGTVWSGVLRVGDAVRLLPSGVESRVRSLEAHGRPVERSTVGARLAVGLAGVERAAVARGDLLVHAGAPWRESGAWDASVSLDAAAPRQLSAGTRVRVHVGTAELMARVQAPAPIAPGGAGLVRLVLERPGVARGGDRLVLRSFSPVTTIGGGRVVDPDPPRRAALEEGLAQGGTAQLRALVARRREGVEVGSLPVLAGLPEDEVRRRLAEAGCVVLAGRAVAAERVAALEARALEWVAAEHAREPSRVGPGVAALRQGLRSPFLAAEIVERLVAGGRLVAEGGEVRSPDHRPRVAGGDAAVEALVALLAAEGWQAPPVAELERRTGRREVLAALQLAAKAGRVVQVQRDWFVEQGAIERFVAVLREVAASAGGEVGVAALRERTGLTRKFLIPLLEWADSARITRRVGEGRVLVSPPA
jgi:selenocysteine-specific elongation factor